MDSACTVSLSLLFAHAIVVVPQENAFPTEMDETLKKWFEEKGGEIHHAVVAEGRAGRRVLKATESFTANASADGDGLVLRVPFKLTLNKITMRNVGLECKGQ